MGAVLGASSVGDLLSAATLAVCLVLVCLALKRLPESRLARPLKAMVACSGLWMVGDTITLFSRTLLAEQVGIAVLYSGVLFLPPCWWLLTLRWTALHRVSHPFRDPRWAQVPFAFAGVMWLAMLANPWHGQFLTPVIGAGNVLRPLWWVMAIPSYGLMVMALGVHSWAFSRVRLPEVRRESGFLLAATLVSLVWNLGAVITHLSLWHGTVTSLAMSSALVVFGLYRDRILGTLPVAFRAIFESDPDGLLILGADGCLLHANKPARALLAPVQLEPGAPVDFAPLDHPALLEDRVLCDAPGGRRVLELRRQVLRGRRGGVRTHLLRLRDVTDEKEAEAELARAERLASLGELSRGVAHDFHNLLAVIGGNAFLLADEVAGADAARQLARIQAAVKQATDLAAQLRLYAGAGDPRREVVELGPLVRETASLFAPEPGRPTRLRLDVAAEPLQVWADPTQFRQVLQNLLVNAGESLDEAGGLVEVTADELVVDPRDLANTVVGHDRPVGRYARISVADTGHGMDRGMRERVFDPFFGTKGKHRGLGLSIVVGFVRSHGGLLTLETRPGDGSRFSVYLPCEE